MKQILNKPYIYWQARDPSVGFQWQFQYARNIDFSNIRNGITLSPKMEEMDTTFRICCYCPMYVAPDGWATLVRFDSWNRVTFANNTDRPTTSWYVWDTAVNIKQSTSFQNICYAFWQWKAYEIAPIVWGLIYDITSAITRTDPNTSITYNYEDCQVLLNYDNTMLLVADKNKLRRYIKVASPWLPIWRKLIRNFATWTYIKWLTMQWSTLKIYVQDELMRTKIFYATGTFDAEYTWLVEQVDADQILIQNVVSDGWSDYMICQNSPWSADFALYKEPWANQMLVKNTVHANSEWYAHDFFGFPWDNMCIKKWILYVPMADGTWTFRQEYVRMALYWRTITAWWLSYSKDNYLWNYYPWKSVIFWDYLYTSCQYWLSSPTSKETRVNIEFRPSLYADSWFLIWRIEDWDLLGMDKENLQLNLWYLLPPWTYDINWNLTNNPWHINVYLRYDRSSLWLWGWRQLVKTLDDPKKMRERLLPSDQTLSAYRNTLEYMIEIVRWDQWTAPVFYEFNLRYNYANRLDKH